MRLLVATPLRVEQLLVRGRLRGEHRVHRTGMGAARSRHAARALRSAPGEALLVAGFCGGLEEGSTPGEVIVAEQVYAADDEGHPPERASCAGAQALLDALAVHGVSARSGAIVCVSRLALGPRRAQLRARGAIAVDMESVWLAAAAGGRPLAVVRVVLDSPSHELLRPRALASAARAAGALRRVARALPDWEPSPARVHEPSGGS
jgi:4-hydroxy-3-methylbut-2-en-1-yl diphosphate reductase